MDEKAWAACGDPKKMLRVLRNSGKLSDRRARLFACAAVRRVWHLLTDEMSKRAVEVAERYADGMADEEELRLANRRLVFYRGSPEAAAFLTSVPRYDRPSVLFRYRIVDMRRPDAVSRVERICSSGSRFPAEACLAVARRAMVHHSSAETAAQAALLCCLFGPLPHCPLPPLPSSVRAWNDSIIVKLASAIYGQPKRPEGTLDGERLGVLADALEEAGVADQEVVGHLRQQGTVHVRGCAALDSLLERK